MVNAEQIGKQVTSLAAIAFGKVEFYFLYGVAMAVSYATDSVIRRSLKYGKKIKVKVVTVRVAQEKFIEPISFETH